MKILWLNSVFPFPLYSGGQVRAYHLLKNLAKKNEITLFSFTRPNREQGPVSELEKFCRKVKIFEGKKTWGIQNVLLAGFSNLPFAITPYWDHHRLKKALNEELRTQNYDLFHFESFYTSAYLDSAQGLPRVMGNENIESLLYQRFAEKKKGLFKKILEFDVLKMKKFEERAWRKAELNLAVSEVDARVIKKTTRKDCPVVPNGVDFESFVNFRISRPPETRPDLLFVGDFRYFANQDALNFLLKDVWPKIKQQLPGTKLWLVGRNSGRFGQKIKQPGVVIDDQVQDIRQVYAQADVMVVPVRLGSGTNIKVLEAMAMGLPVVSTSIGVEGIPVKKGREVIVADKPEEFAQEVIALLNNSEKRKKIGLAGQKIIKRQFDWGKITRQLEKTYERLVNGHQKS